MAPFYVSAPCTPAETMRRPLRHVDSAVSVLGLQPLYPAVWIARLPGYSEFRVYGSEFRVQIARLRCRRQPVHPRSLNPQAASSFHPDQARRRPHATEHSRPVAARRGRRLWGWAVPCEALGRVGAT